MPCHPSVRTGRKCRQRGNMATPSIDENLQHNQTDYQHLFVRVNSLARFHSDPSCTAHLASAKWELGHLLGLNDPQFLACLFGGEKRRSISRRGPASALCATAVSSPGRNVVQSVGHRPITFSAPAISPACIPGERRGAADGPHGVPKGGVCPKQ